MRAVLIALLLSSCAAPIAPVALRHATNFLMDYDGTTPLERHSVMNAIDQINARLGCTKLAVFYDTKANRPLSNTIVFTDIVEIKDKEAALAATTIWFDRNLNSYLSSLEILKAKDVTKYEFSVLSDLYGSIIVHEIGHSLGLNHAEDDEQNVMYPYLVAYGVKNSLYPDTVWDKFIKALNKNGITCDDTEN